jgi:CRISPR-associated protein Cas6
MISTGEIEPHVVDLFFRVQGKELDVDHGYALYAAISRILEHEEDRWLHAADHIGLHPLRGRYLGQGRLLLNPRAQLGLRLPVNLISRALKLAGKRLEVNGDSL